MLVLDPVSMTGGGKEDEENYQAYRAAALSLASERDLVVALLTNTGHAIRTRGRNSSMLVDGMDASVALVKDPKTGIVTVTDNKQRDMAGVGDLRLKFVGAGEMDEATGKHLSGVWAPLTEDDKEELLAEEIERQRKRLNDALNLATLGPARSVRVQAAQRRTDLLAGWRHDRRDGRGVGARPGRHPRPFQGGGMGAETGRRAGLCARGGQDPRAALALGQGRGRGPVVGHPSMRNH